MIRFYKVISILSLMLVFILSPLSYATTLGSNLYSDKQNSVGTRDIVQEIINVVGLKPRFELMAADIANAAAVVYNGKRYILYNRQFISSINTAAHTDWGGVSIIAHEIGHHLNGHTLSRNGSNPNDELEADEFSGFVLRKMGASLSEAQAAINLMPDIRSSRTHPGRSARLEAINKGWRSANEQLITSSKLLQPDYRSINPSHSNQPKSYSGTTQKQRPVFDQRLVLNRVYFDESPREEFYITTKLLLVYISDEGIRILGKVAKTNNPEFPFYLKSDQIQPLFITDRGVLVNRKGQKVGYVA